MELICFFRNIFFVFLLLSCLPACNSLFYQPSSELLGSPADAGLEYRDLFFRVGPDSSSIKLNAWFLDSKQKNAKCLFFLHGNAANILNHLQSVYWMPKHGIDVFLFDYRGYGRSEGKPSQAGVRADVHAALKYLVESDLCESKQITVLGQSLGGALGIELVATSDNRDRVNALVVDSAFSSYRLIVREKASQHLILQIFQRPLSWLFSNQYSPQKFIEKLPEIPLLFIHGDADRVVPIHHGEALYRAAKQPKDFWTIKNGIHIESFQNRELRKSFVEWISAL